MLAYMNKCRIVRTGVLVFIVCAFGATSAVLWRRSVHERCSGPIYLGKPLGDWLADLGANPDDTNARAAFVAAGTNALPCLLQALVYPKTLRGRTERARRTALAAMRIPIGPLRDPALLRYKGIDAAIQVLGIYASNAAPAVSKLLDDPVAGHKAATILSDIGALPALIEALTNRSELVRRHGLAGLAGLSFSDPSVALPQVLCCLDTTNCPEVRLSAAVVLGVIDNRAAGTNTEARNAVTQMLGDSNPFLRQVATNILSRPRE